MSRSATLSKPTRAEPVPLEGTPGQVAWGEGIRRSKLVALRRTASPEQLELLYSVKDATWWIANRARALGEIRWPSPHQLVGGDPDGGGLIR